MGLATPFLRYIGRKSVYAPLAMGKANRETSCAVQRQTKRKRDTLHSIDIMNKKIFWIVLDLLGISWGFFSVFAGNFFGIAVGMFASYLLIKEIG